MRFWCAKAALEERVVMDSLGVEFDKWTKAKVSKQSKPGQLRTTPRRLQSRPKLLQKNSLQRKGFGAIDFVKNSKESLYKTNSLPCCCKKGHPSGSNITKKIFWWYYFVILTNIITKEKVPRNYFVIMSARTVKFVKRMTPQRLH